MNMPRGPSEEEVLAQKQKEADNELWNKIMYEYAMLMMLMMMIINIIITHVGDDDH